MKIISHKSFTLSSIYIFPTIIENFRKILKIERKFEYHKFREFDMKNSKHSQIFETFSVFKNLYFG